MSCQRELGPSILSRRNRRPAIRSNVRTLSQCPRLGLSGQDPCIQLSQADADDSTQKTTWMLKVIKKGEVRE